jgi:predicted dienelactone hydrolase
MRTLEIGLLVILLALVVWPLTPWRRRSDWRAALAITAVFLTALHLLWEGYRWQMVPAYGLTAVYLLLAMLERRRAPGDRPHRWPLLVALPIWLVAALLPYLLPVPRLPAPTGPYAVGTAVYHLVDAQRPEQYTADPDDKRELMVQLWYPAEVAPGLQTAPYFEDLAAVQPALGDALGLSPFLVGHLNLVKTAAWADAPPLETGEPFAVILFSHGVTTGVRNQNTSMVQELVSHGYVVVGIDHTFGNLFTRFPDGRIVFYDPIIFNGNAANARDGQAVVATWRDDARFVLDSLAQWNAGAGEGGARFSGRFDLERVGMFGHSTGGGTAVSFCAVDARCRAGLGLDAWVLPVPEDVVARGLAQPFMFISTPRWLGADNAARGQAIFAAVQAPAYNLAVTGTEHFDYSDIPLFSPLTPQLGLSGSLNGRYTLAILNRYTLAFFDQALRGRPAELLAGPSPYPEVQVRQNGR